MNGRAPHVRTLPGDGLRSPLPRRGRPWPLRALLVLLLAGALHLAWPSSPARAEGPDAACFSIQVGTFANPDNARRYHARLLSLLPPIAADQLRMERIGPLNVLRIGRAASKAELAPLLAAVQAVVDIPRVMEVDFLPGRVLIPPRRAAAAPGRQPAPAAPQAQPASLPAVSPAPAAPGTVPAEGFAVQVGSFHEPMVAERSYARLYAALPRAMAAQLRLEAIGGLMVLRLGQAANKEELEPLLEAARAAGEEPRIQAADYRPERFLIAPGASAPAPAPETDSPQAPAMPTRAASVAPRPEALAGAPLLPAAPPAEPAAEPRQPPVPAPLVENTPALQPAPAEPLPEAIATGYSVQLGSYASRGNALAAHSRLLTALPPDLAADLRLERVGIYYVLRLGLGPTRSAMLPVLERVRTYAPLPVLLAADLDPDRLVIPPHGLGREAAAGPSDPALVQAPAAEPASLALPAPASAMADQTPPVLDEPLPPLLPFGSTQRERDLMAARIATRTGKYPQGKKLYEKILAEHPGDEEVLEQYVDALVDALEYDLAQQLLADWMKRDPENPRPRRLLGLMFVRSGEYERSYAPFMDLLERDPGDIGVMADLGFAKLGGGDWQHALQLFSAVADEQPDNEVAAQIVQELLIAHRPRLASDYVSEFRADDAVLSTWRSAFSSPLSDRWALDLNYGLIHVDRPSKAAQEPIEHTVQDWMLTARTLLHEHLTAYAGLGAVSGIGDRATSQAGLEWRVHRPGRILVLAEHNRPWTDRVDATRYEGFQDHASMAYDALFDDRWGLYLAAERYRYSILDHEYGRRNVGSGRLLRRLGWKPNLWLGYAYSFGTSEYDEAAPRVLSGDTLVLPVALDREEESHSWFLTMDERLCSDLRLVLSAGAGQNTISGNAFFFGTGEFLVEVSNRLTVRAGLGYNSDKSSVGGETTTLTVGILWIF